MNRNAVIIENGVTLLPDHEIELPEGAHFLQLPKHEDERGVLTPLEFSGLPFQPRRMFLVHGAKGGATRGGHAHRTGHQLMLCVSGCVVVSIRSGKDNIKVDLTPGTSALYVMPGVWTQQYYDSPEDHLMVLASDAYSSGAYLDENEA